MQVKRSISNLELLFASLGCIIGSGWLFGPFYAAKIAGPASIVAWVIGGILMLLIALTFAELSTMFPLVGGIVRFAQFSHGTLVSFTMSWIGWVSCLIVAPLEVIAVLQYAANYLPWLVRTEQGTHVLTSAGIGVAAVLLLLMCILNIVGTKVVMRVNTTIVWVKLFIPAFIVALLFYYGFHFSHIEKIEEFAPFGMKGVFESLPTAGIIMSFIGFTTAISLAGESAHPQRSVPLALIGSLVACIVFYVVLEFVFIGSIPPEWLNAGWGKLAFTGDAGPIAGIITSLGVTWLLFILYFDAIISPAGVALTYTTATARMNYAMSENGYMPRMMLNLNKAGVPVTAIIVNFVLGMFLLLPFPGWQSIVTFLVSAVVLSYAVGPLSLIVLRKTLPDHNRPFKLPAAFWLCFIAFYVCNLIVYWTGWDIVWHILLAICVGYIWLGFYKRTKHGREMDLQWKAAWWLLPYFIGLGMISYLGTFGGGIGVITLGWDFLVLAVFSTIIFFCAVRWHSKDVSAVSLSMKAI